MCKYLLVTARTTVLIPRPGPPQPSAVGQLVDVMALRFQHLVRAITGPSTLMSRAYVLSDPSRRQHRHDLEEVVALGGADDDDMMT